MTEIKLLTCTVKEYIKSLDLKPSDFELGSAIGCGVDFPRAEEDLLDKSKEMRYEAVVSLRPQALTRGAHDTEAVLYGTCMKRRK